jgi:hypothetical protein
VFFDHHHSPLTCHPWAKTKLKVLPAAANETDKKLSEAASLLDYEAKPDLVATEAPVFEDYRKWDGSRSSRTGVGNYRGFPWHHVRTVVELQSGGVDESERQTATYVGDVHQSRPDLAGAYGLCVSSGNYSIHWSDCTGAYMSPRFQWSNLDPLVQFVVSLYRPPHGHRDAYDETVKLVKREEKESFVRDDPHWRFDILPDSSFNVIFVAPAHSRGTRIFQQQNSRDTQKVPLIIKEVYVPKSGRRYDEAEMLKYLHSTHREGQDGTLWGCLRAIEPEGPLAVRTPGWADEEARVKRRLLCFDTGKIIARSSSVLQFLEATFDSLERERFLAGYVTYLAVLTKNSSSPRCI